MDRVDTVVVGAGVVGLAIAHELAVTGREVLVLEAAAQFGSGVSSRNSEVIHAGLYYEPGSLKARLCVEGRRLLYAWCEERGVAHRRCGKLIVATEPGQRGALERIEQRALAAGVADLRWLSAGEARAMEPALHCESALSSPSTGIVDSHGLMLSLLGAAEDHGAALACRSRVRRVEIDPEGFRLLVESAGGEVLLGCGELVNSAGLGAVALANTIEGLSADLVPRAWLAKGNYFSLQGRCPFSRLVYPVPNEAGLGVHLTLDLAGQGRFGPDVEWVDDEDYAVDPASAAGFVGEIRRYWPEMPEGALQAAYAGIRPKIAGPNESARDFVLSSEAEHGLRGLVNLFGIESPGLTSSLAIASHVRALLDAGDSDLS
ncbi:MAG TPA: NAD(P)/FAD-dependent oxidoreductase [Quisquiliibacterium sp.]|nr:NAD(P)/FAD-dependent oxidoreductase [Quisquiliibacterium sp.]